MSSRLPKVSPRIEQTCGPCGPTSPSKKVDESRCGAPPVLTNRGCPLNRFQLPHSERRYRPCHLLSILYLSSRKVPRSDGKAKTLIRNAVFKVAKNNSEPHTQPSAPSSKLSALTSHRVLQPGRTPVLQPRREARNTLAAILSQPRTLAF